jgi:two-component system cell cycle sensor histidine kinase/response regulator CckA
VVDDDESIRKLIQDTLQPLGYKVISAASGIEALEKCAQTGNTIDLLLSDVIMPGMNGKQLVERMKDLCPHVKAMLMSGYTDNVIAHHGVMDSEYTLINKPLMPIPLANKIREVLDDQSTKIQTVKQKT